MSSTSLTVLKRSLKMLQGQAKLDKDTTILELIKLIDGELEKKADVLPKELVHFLKKRSYQKALQFIEKNEIV